MKDIPKTIQIGLHTITISFEKGLKDEKGNPLCGSFEGSKLHITIDSDIPDTLKIETFWHEVVEALVFFLEIKMPHDKIQSFGLLLSQVAGQMTFENEPMMKLFTGRK